jgi:hypothetical protein
VAAAGEAGHVAEAADNGAGPWCDLPVAQLARARTSDPAEQPRQIQSLIDRDFACLEQVIWQVLEDRARSAAAGS